MGDGVATTLGMGVTASTVGSTVGEALGAIDAAGAELGAGDAANWELVGLEAEGRWLSTATAGRFMPPFATTKPTDKTNDPTSTTSAAKMAGVGRIRAAWGSCDGSTSACVARTNRAQLT